MQTMVRRLTNMAYRVATMALGFAKQCALGILHALVANPHRDVVPSDGPIIPKVLLI